ncbi:hypothetical protein PI124_g6890 [Phytophthora idaei]|nr:hypothetical protein PI124_g6890 [Phytophthora idaei]
METLHEQLFAIGDDQFKIIEALIGSSASPSAPQGLTNKVSIIAQCPDYTDPNNGKKRMARSCKVVVAYQVKPRKFTNYHWPGCSVDDPRKHLCNVARPGNAKSCWYGWHEDWGSGQHIPESVLEGRRVQERHPGKKHARTSRRRVDMDDGQVQEENRSATGDDVT